VGGGISEFDAAATVDALQAWVPRQRLLRQIVPPNQDKLAVPQPGKSYVITITLITV